jgi:hypothetical protein
MLNDGTPPLQPNPNCTKCGGATELLSFIRRFGDQPAYHIFDCPTCNALTGLRRRAAGEIAHFNISYILPKWANHSSFYSWLR